MEFPIHLTADVSRVHVLHRHVRNLAVKIIYCQLVSLELLTWQFSFEYVLRKGSHREKKKLCGEQCSSVDLTKPVMPQA